MSHCTFTDEIYAEIRDGAQRSAYAVAPIVQEQVRARRVVDVGCGEGWWARAFWELGCDVMGLDESIDGEHGEGDQNSGHVLWFRHADLTRLADLPPDYDLAVCLEVAEHLEARFADQLVGLLTAAAPVVLFSAAVPGQGGHGHVNEQWPAYWAEKFAGHGYFTRDELRWRIWGDERIEPWYQQNSFLFERSSEIEPTRERAWPPAVVHPVTFTHIRALYDAANA